MCKRVCENGHQNQGYLLMGRGQKGGQAEEGRERCGGEDKGWSSVLEE